MSSYSDYDLERDLRDARRARARAAGRRVDGGRFNSSGIGDWLRSRTTEHWIMFAIGFVAGAILF